MMYQEKDKMQGNLYCSKAEIKAGWDDLLSISLSQLTTEEKWQES